MFYQLVCVNVVSGLVVLASQVCYGEVNGPTLWIILWRSSKGVLSGSTMGGCGQGVA